jgi:hypothetical protein
MAAPLETYASWKAVTTSDTVPISCKAIYVGGTGDVTVAPSVGGTPVTFKAVPVGAILPIELNEGTINATATTATLMIALA